MNDKVVGGNVGVPEELLSPERKINYGIIFSGFLFGSLAAVSSYFLGRYLIFILLWGDVNTFFYFFYSSLPILTIFGLLVLFKNYPNFRRGLKISFIIGGIILLNAILLLLNSFLNDYYYQQAIDNLDTSYCDKMKSSARYIVQCNENVNFIMRDYYYKMAIATSDYSYCDKVGGHKSLCIHDIDVGYADRALMCPNSDSCRKWISDDYYYKMAVDTLNSKHCLLIESNSYRKECYGKTLQE